VRISQLIALATFAASVVWGAEKVYVPNLDLINVNAKFQYSTLKQLKSYTDETGTYDLVIPARADSALPQPSKEEALAKARENGYPYVLLGTMNALGDNLFISIQLLQTSSGNIVWSDKMKATGPEDLDPIMSRVGKALGTERKAVAADDIYNVTDAESSTLRKKPASKMIGVGIGGLILPNSPTDDNFLPGLDLYATYDARNVIAEIRTGWQGTGHTTGMQVAINVFKPLNDEAQSFFVGGGLGYGYLSYLNLDTTYGNNFDIDAGLLAMVGGGYLFNRTSTLQIRCDVDYWVYTFKINDKLPQGIKATLNLSWSR